MKGTRAPVVTRRELLELTVATAAMLLRGGHVSARPLTPARDAVDHLILGCANLESGIAWFEQLTGVRAAVSGRHPGRGTRNALASLGGRQYLEILAPDPAQAAELTRDLAALPEPRLVGWAVAAADLAAVVRNSRDAGARISDPRDGSRARPDGTLLTWRTAAVFDEPDSKGISPVPFFIEWGAGTVHPSQDSPAGCRLETFGLEHPAPERLQAALKRLGIDARVLQSPEVALTARLATPKGSVSVR